MNCSFIEGSSSVAWSKFQCDEEIKKSTTRGGPPIKLIYFAFMNVSETI